MGTQQSKSIQHWKNFTQRENISMKVVLCHSNQRLNSLSVAIAWRVTKER